MLVRDMPWPRRAIYRVIGWLQALDKRVRLYYADCKKCGDSGVIPVGSMLADCPCRANSIPDDWDF